MDWFSWLSKTNLEPQQFIHEYTQSFTQNLLEEDDISHFNHELLQSMGISIAKHRLEILKLAKSSTSSHPVTKLINAMKKTKTKVAKYVQTWVHRNDSALIIAKRSYSSRWKGAMVKRSNRLVMNKPGGSSSGQLLITNGYRPVVRPNGSRVTSFSSPLVYDSKTMGDSNESTENLYSDGDEGSNSNDVEDRSRASRDAAYWPNDDGVEDIKWDAMFQNLKPT